MATDKSFESMVEKAKLEKSIGDYDRNIKSDNRDYKRDEFSKLDYTNYQSKTPINNKDFFGGFIQRKNYDAEYRSSGRPLSSYETELKTGERLENYETQKRFEEETGMESMFTEAYENPNTYLQQEPTQEQQTKSQNEQFLEYVGGLDEQERDKMVSGMAGNELAYQSLFNGHYDQYLPFNPNELEVPDAVALGQSLLAGTGIFISGIGDMLTFVQSTTPATHWLVKMGDPVGDIFRSIGGEIQDSWELQYKPESLQEFTWNDLTNARFWTQEVATVVPDAVSMLLGGYGVAKGFLKVASKAGKVAVAKGLVTPGVRAGGVTIKKGSGFGRMFTTAGSPTGAGALTTRLTRNSAQLITGIGGGVGMNFIDGARVAGGAYNEAINRGLTHDQAGMVAADVWIDNAKWLPVDMLSFGFTYAGVGSRIFGKQVAKNVATKTGTFANRAGRFTKSLARTAGVAVPEGIEEMFQETYQDWMVGKNLAHAEGKMFIGPNGENYEGSFLDINLEDGTFFGDGYWNYLQTQGKKTAAISAILGAGMGGGAFAVSQMAERNRTIDRREEFLNKVMKDATLSDIEKKQAILNHVMSDAFATGSTHADMQSYIDNLLEKGKIDETTHQRYTEHLDSSMEMIQNTPFAEDMTTEMRAEYFNRTFRIGDLNDNISEVNNQLKEQLSNIDKQQGVSPEKKAEQKEIAELEAEETIRMIEEEISINRSVQNAIVNEVITQKDTRGRRRYKKGVKQTAEGKETRGGRFASEKDQLTEKEQKYTKQSQIDKLSPKYRKQAVENLEKLGIETTENNILQEMKRLQKGKRTGVVKSLREGVKDIIDTVKKGVKKVRETGVPQAVAGGVKSAIDAIRGVVKGDTNINQVTKDLAQASGKVARNIFSNIKTFVKNFKGAPIYKEDGTPTDQKFVDKIMKTLEDNSGVPFTQMNDQEKKDIIEQLFPSQNMEQISNMTEEEFSTYVKNRFVELEKSQQPKETKQVKGEVTTGESPQQEAKKKRDKEKEVRFFAEAIADGKSFTTKEEKQFYENNKKEIEEELKKIQKEREGTPTKKKKGRRTAAKKKVDKASPEEKRAKKKVDSKKKKKKRLDPFGNKRLKVDTKKTKQSPNIDRFGAATPALIISSILKTYKSTGRKLDKAAVIVLEDLSETLPSYAVGMALSGATFIRANDAWQDILAHEYGGHIFYRAYSHTKFVKDGIKNLIGTDLWNDTKEKYFYLTMYEFTNPVTGEKTNMTIDDISKTLGRIVQDKRTKLYKSQEAEFRNIREAMTTLYEAMLSGNYNAIQQGYKKLEIQLKAANMLSDLQENQQEALKEEVWARSTELKSKEVVEQLLGANPEKIEKHEGYAKRFWNKIKAQFGKEEVQIPLQKLRDVLEQEEARPTVNTYSSASYMLRSDIEGKFGRNLANSVRPYLSSLFRDLTKLAKKSPKTIKDIAMDDEKLKSYISDSFEKLGFRFNHTAFGKDSMKILSDFVRPLAKYHALTIDPNFKSKVKELTIMDWFEDLSSRDVNEEILNETSKELLTEQDWIIKGKEMIDDFMIRQGMDPDMFLENLEGDGKINYEDRKGGQQPVSLTVQKLIKMFTKERYSEIKKGFRKVGDKEIESYEKVTKALRNAKVLQGDLLLAGISSRYDAHQFIEILRSSENVQTAEFINWLENKFGTREDANAFLMMMHKEFSDRMQENFYGVTQTEDNTGSKEFVTKQLLSYQEGNMMENINNMLESFYGKKHKDKQLDKLRTEQILAIVTELEKGLDQSRAVSLLKMLVNNYSGARTYIDWTNISFNGITIDGKTMNIKNATEKYVKKSIFKRGGQFFIKASTIKPLIEQLVLQSRKKNYVTLINNIEGKPTNISNKSSFLTRKVENINDIFRRKENETLEEYSERVDSLLENNEYNIFTFLAAHEQELEIGLRSGMDSEVNNQASVYERMSGIELMVGDMSQFFENYEEGVVGSYNVPIAVFAEKSRRYGINGRLFTNKKQLIEQIEKLDYLAGLTYKDGSIVFPLLNSNGKFNQESLNKSVEEQIEFIRKNPSVFKNKTFRRIVDPKTGKLKQGHKKFIELMIMNYAFNRIQAQRLLIDRHENYQNLTDYSKRAAGSIARHIPFDKSINMDVVMFEDIYKTEDGRFLSETEAMDEYGSDYKNLLTIVTDGSMFVLEEQAQEIKDSYGPLNDYGEHFKFVYNGNSQESLLPLEKTTTSESVYLKGNTFVLTEEAVKDSIYLQNIKRLLESRNKYFAKDNNVNYNNMFTIAVSNSSIKAAHNKNEILHSISGTKEMKNFNNIHSIQEENYSDGMNYVGLDGTNFGVQLILDTKQKSSPLSIQLFSNILINGNKHAEKVNKVLDLFARSMKAKSNERVKKMKAKDGSSAVTVNRNIMQSIGEWAGSANNNLSKNASPLFPKNNIIKNSLGGNALAQTGARIYLDQLSERHGAGTRAYQSSEGINLRAYTNIVTRSGESVYGSEFVAPHNLKEIGFKKGDVIIGTRIPGKSKADHAVLVIKDFHSKKEGAKISLPSELSETIGSDLDGDAIFLSGRYNIPVASTARVRETTSIKLYNRGFDALVELLQEPDFRTNEIEKGIDIKSSSEEAIRQAENNLGIEISKDIDLNTPMGDMEIFNNNIPARGLIGIITNMARDMHYLSYHNVGFKTSITINGRTSTEFNNDNPLNYFPVAQSQNVALDNAKYLFATNLGMNKNTVKPFIILQRLGFSTAEVATIMNSEAAKLYDKHVGLRMVTQKSSEKININPALKALYDLKNNGRNVEDDLVNTMTKQEAWEKINFEYKGLLTSYINNDIEIDFANIKKNPDKFNLQVLKLLYYTDNLSKDIQSINNLLGIYKGYPKDSFAAKRIKDDINSLLEESSLLERDGVVRLLQNPIVNRNLEVLQEIDNQYRFTNIVDSREAHMINEIMEELTEEKNPMGYHPRVARNYGLQKMENNISYLKDLKSKDVLLDIIQKARIMYPENIALHEAISLQGQRNYDTNLYEINTIRINRQVIHEYTSNEIIEDYKDSFQELPAEVQNAIIQLDYLDNRWAGGTTAYIWSNNIWDNLNPQLEKLRKQTSQDPLSENHLRNIALNIIKDQYRLMPTTKKSGSLTKSGKNWKYSPGKRESKILDLQDRNIKHYIKHWDAGQGKYVRLEYIEGQRYKAIDEVSKGFTNDNVDQKIERIEETLKRLKKKGPTNIQDVGEYLNKWKSGSNMIRPSYRVNLKDYATLDTFKVLSYDNWLKRKKIDKTKLVKGSKAELEAKYKYNKYVAGMEKAQSLYFDLSDPTNMSKFDSELLIDLAIEFNNPKQFEQEVSKVMEGLISVELANRAAIEQSKINKTGPETAGVNDIGNMKMWLISNNIPAEHPAVQNLVKQMELHHRKYVTAYTQQVKDLARSERDLDRYMTKKYGYTEKMRLLFTNKWADTKYKNLIKIIPTNDGDNYIELLDEKTLKNNNVSQQEIDFHRNFVSSMKKFGKTKEGYIPHLMMGSYESLMKRGLFGLYNSNLGNTARIDEVMVEGLGPTGREVRSFGEWRKIYERGEWIKGGRKIKELETIRKKAMSYLQKGVDANGNEIGLSLTETKSLLGSSLFSDFASSEQVKMSELGSTDLGKIGRLFVRSSVFANGDMNVENSTGFSGMKRMAPLVDGIIRVYKDNNNPRMAKYVEEVWRDGYLQNRKQESLTKVGDRILDLIIKHTLYVALGFGIIPAIGNVLIGKYNQLRSKGGKEFILGEKRFWNPETFKRNQLIIDQVMKHEYNVFDDIYSVNERSWIDKLVFWPMNASEKWIQGAAFLGTFTEEELNQFEFDNDGLLINSPISEEQIVKRYDSIKREQGRGFSPVDQRLMGMYSWGRALLQFTRWLPTLINERFGSEQINRFGEMEIGSYTAAAEYGRDLIMGRKTWDDFGSLPKHKQEAIRQWFRGAKITIAVGILGMLASAMGSGGEDPINKLHDDILIFTDYDRMKWTLTPASAFTVANYIDGVKNIVSQEKAKRPGKYLDTGEKKWKTNIYKSVPSPLIIERDLIMK